MLEFDAERFIGEYCALGGRIFLTDANAATSPQWLGIYPPGRDSDGDTMARARAMRRELVAEPQKEDAVVAALAGGGSSKRIDARRHATTAHAYTIERID